MRSLAMVLVLVTACASSRVRGDGDDVDASGGGLETDASSAELDGAAVTVDARDPVSCGAVDLETVAAWPKLPGGWQTVPAIAVGPGGEVVVVYNVDEGPLVASTRNSNGTWTAAPIDAVVGSAPSIAFAPDGTLHACYVRTRSSSQGPLVCASRPPGGAWSTRTVDDNWSRWPSVAIDPFGRLNVAYVRDDGLAVASQSSGGGWSTYDMPAWGAEAASLAYDAQGRDYVVWSMPHEGYPSLFERATGFVDGTFAWVTPHSLAIDGAGRVHLGFARYRNEQISYAYRDADHVWHFEHDLDGDGLIVPRSTALALGAAGEVHVTYQSRLTGEHPERVRHAIRSSGTWTTETLYEATAYHPSSTTSAAGADGHIHIAFDALPDAAQSLRTVYYVRRCGTVDPH